MTYEKQKEPQLEVDYPARFTLTEPELAAALERVEKTDEQRENGRPIFFLMYRDVPWPTGAGYSAVYFVNASPYSLDSVDTSGGGFSGEIGMLTPKGIFKEVLPMEAVLVDLHDHYYDYDYVIAYYVSVESKSFGTRRFGTDPRRAGPEKRILLRERELNLPSDKFKEALALAFDIHRSQLRKSTSIPYISHLLSVAALVMEHGGSEEEAIAALLHDSLEDGDGGRYPGGSYALRDDIPKRFGDKVLELVQGCTDAYGWQKREQKGLETWRKRKEAHLKKLETAPPSVLLISCADKVHNMRAIVADYEAIGAQVFERFNAGQEGTLWYYGEVEKILRARLPGALSDELSRLYSKLRGGVA